MGKPVFDEAKRASWFSHKAEKTTPYYYSVYLADYDVTAELCPTERAALMAFTFPKTDQANVVIDAFDKGSCIQVIPAERKVIGFSTRNSGGVPDNFRNYFVIEFDHDFDAFVSVKDGQLISANEQKGNHVGAIITFKTSQRGEKIQARVASSFISSAQAMQNLKELGQADMDQLKQQGRQCWNEVLGKRMRVSIISVLSIAVSIARYFSLVHSTRRMLLAKSCITVLTMVRFRRAICSRILVSGILSAVSSLFST